MYALVPIEAVGASLTAAVASLAAVGVLGLLGGSSDDPDLSAIARRLDAREDVAAIERKLDDLEDAIDTLVARADLDRHLRSPPAADASSVEKAEALSRAVERDQLSVRPATDTGTGREDAGTVATAAARVKRERSPSSPTARRLLDGASSPGRADPDELEAAFERAVSALDTERSLERALDGVDEDGLGPNDARRVRNELGHPNNEVTRGVRRLAEAAEEGHSTAERRETERERIGDATDTLTSAAEDASDLDVGPNSRRSVAERLGVLADAVSRDELGFSEDAGGDGRVPEIATEVRRSRNPESTVAKRLLDRLASPGIGDLRPALDTAVEQLDAASTTQSIVADLDREAVRDLAEDVEARLDGASGPAADALGERVADLRGMLDRADDSNAVIPYAVRNELRFYDRTLLAELGSGDVRQGAESGAGAGATGGDTSVGLSALADRREEVEDRYVDGRRDHNHSIPLHFLSLVDALREDAERAATGGDDERAAGLVAAAEETVDYVEQLYEKNEYSVMLRRLRG